MKSNLINRISQVDLDMPSKDNWELKLERAKKFPANPEKWHCDSRGLKDALNIESVRYDTDAYGTSDQDMTVYQLFRKVITAMGFDTLDEFDRNATWDQVEECFELARRFAQNWSFS